MSERKGELQHSKIIYCDGNLCPFVWKYFNNRTRYKWFSARIYQASMVFKLKELKKNENKRTKKKLSNINHDTRKYCSDFTRVNRRLAKESKRKKKVKSRENWREKNICMYIIPHRNEVLEFWSYMCQMRTCSTAQSFRLTCRHKRRVLNQYFLRMCVCLYVCIYVLSSKYIYIFF